MLLQSPSILQCIFMFLIGWKTYNNAVWQQIPVGGNLSYSTWQLMGKRSSALALRCFPSALHPCLLRPTQISGKMFKQCKFCLIVVIYCWYCENTDILTSLGCRGRHSPTHRKGRPAQENLLTKTLYFSGDTSFLEHWEDHEPASLLASGEMCTSQGVFFTSALYSP